MLKYVGMTFDEDGDLTTIVMERASDTLEGLAKKRVASGQGFTMEEVQLVMRCVFDALKYMHSRNPPVYHRDIKADNVFVIVNDEGQLVSAKLGDMDCAKVRRILIEDM